VLARWRSEGCYDEIGARLGYRLSLTEAQLPTEVRPGGNFTFSISLENTGWAAPFGQRPVLLVLEGEGTTASVQLQSDPRRWLPGTPVVLEGRVELPATLAEGQYRLALALPDRAPSLKARPEFAIRLANSGVWSSVDGSNTLATLSVPATAPGRTNPAASGFRLEC